MVSLQLSSLQTSPCSFSHGLKYPELTFSPKLDCLAPHHLLHALQETVMEICSWHFPTFSKLNIQLVINENHNCQQCRLPATAISFSITSFCPKSACFSSTCGDLKQVHQALHSIMQRIFLHSLQIHLHTVQLGSHLVNVTFSVDSDLNKSSAVSTASWKTREGRW